MTTSSQKGFLKEYKIYKARELIEGKVISMKCVSCGKNVDAEQNWVEFDCPACGKEHITRCRKCKEMENTYECPKCGFMGP